MYSFIHTGEEKQNKSPAVSEIPHSLSLTHTCNSHFPFLCRSFSHLFPSHKAHSIHMSTLNSTHRKRYTYSCRCIEILQHGRIRHSRPPLRSAPALGPGGRAPLETKTYRYCTGRST